jgi:hypothetical protein
MFNFLRDLRKSEEERRQEALSAYLDDALTPAEKRRFEQLLASDEGLRARVEAQRLIKMSLSHLPRVKAPRNFTLDPALYGRPVPGTAERLYPMMRLATAVVAILFVVVLVIDLAPFGARQEATESLAESPPVAAEVMEEAADAEAPMLADEAEQAPERVVEVTRIIETEVEVEGEEMAAEEAIAEEPAPPEAPAEEAEMADEEAPLPGPDEAMGGGAPPGETPLAMAVPPAADQATAATEGQATENRAAVETPRIRPTIATEAPAAEDDLATSEEFAGEPSSPETPVVPTPAFDDGLVQEAADTTTRLPTSQVIAIGLGLLLVVLVAVTLLVRRQAG